MSSMAGYFPVMFCHLAYLVLLLPVILLYSLANLDPTTVSFMVQKLYCPLSPLLQADNIRGRYRVPNKSVNSLVLYERVGTDNILNILLFKVFNGLFPCVSKISP